MIIDRFVDQMLARLLCSVIGHLVVIDSQNELDLLAPNLGAAYWVDLNDIETEGKWVTSLTGNAGFINWNIPTEPSNGTDKDCAMIRFKRMDDANCILKNHFICEI